VQREVPAFLDLGFFTVWIVAACVADVQADAQGGNYDYKYNKNDNQDKALERFTKSSCDQLHTHNLAYETVPSPGPGKHSLSYGQCGNMLPLDVFDSMRILFKRGSTP